MKLVFDYDPERHEVSFAGDGFRVSSVVTSYEDIGEFAKRVIEHDIFIPNFEEPRVCGRKSSHTKGEDD